MNVAYCNGGVDANGDCLPFLGEDQECMDWCQSMATTYKFENGKYTCSYIPSGDFSDGSCAVSGTI